MFVLRFTDDAMETLQELGRGGPQSASKLRKVNQTLARLQQNPRYPGLHSHQYESFPGYGEDKVWDSYVENHTPSAWRIYWRYGPNEKTDQGDVQVITVLVIGPHL
ncbi:hypothetical protein ACIGXA_31125 [Streptomyces fildesensis]|uniref:Type II toxin-antitoxin system RelE/ParE family toxin n=1 Tax=Streptomyces fildesensis TaxID=375757 RepID=A0ABW8CGQ1_9ACTN